jgi:cell fate regulator YaaT (PSP1 superfamily)
MPKVVSVRFKPVTKVYYFDPEDFTDLDAGDRVIVETARGVEMGAVVSPVHEVSKSDLKGSLKQVIRKATPVELVQAQQYRTEEPAALQTCTELATNLKLPIKILEADYNFDGSRLTFSFVSEQRIDFRELVKELARTLRTRIEMKQVGARDETKVFDGYGRCGRPLCCSSWLTDFHPVSIRMAKRQGLPLAPSEISGLCGRLLCCLAYEDDFYAEMREKLPRVNSRVKTETGEIGKVRGVNVLKESLLLQMEETETYLELPVSEVEVLVADRSKVGGKKSKPRDKTQASDDDNGQLDD